MTLFSYYHTIIVNKKERINIMSIKRSDLFYSEDSRDIEYTHRIHKALEKLKEKYPYYRVTQIMINTIRTFGYPEDSLWGIEDKALALMLEEMVEHNNFGIKINIIEDV